MTIWPNPEPVYLTQRLVGRPYGFDENGQPIRQFRGLFFRSALDYLRVCVRRKAEALLGSDLSIEEREARLKQVEADALTSLVNRANDVIHHD